MKIFAGKLGNIRSVYLLLHQVTISSYRSRTLLETQILFERLGQGKDLYLHVLSTTLPALVPLLRLDIYLLLSRLLYSIRLR